MKAEISFDKYMLGNWVMFGGRPVTILGIRSDNGFYVLCDNNGIWESEGVTPIELTVDILENNFPTAELIGWYPCDDEKNGFHIDYCPEGIMPSGDYDEFTACVKYVHELQNLITIFKIDKQIVL
jgi:hypothetical protein